MSDLILKGGTVVAIDQKRRIIRDGAIAISGNKIEFVGKREEVDGKFKSDTVIDSKGKFIFPGLINAHDHMFQVMLRNLGVDVVLLEWLKKVIHPAISILKLNFNTSPHR